jgi:hypothetical protein
VYRELGKDLKLFLRSGIDCGIVNEKRRRERGEKREKRRTICKVEEYVLKSICIVLLFSREKNRFFCTSKKCISCFDDHLEKLHFDRDAFLFAIKSFSKIVEMMVVEELEKFVTI